LEDAYLSIIAPLSKEAKLPSLEEIFDAGWESAIHEQSQEQWKVANKVVHLLWKTFVTSSKQDEMAVRTTAVVMELLRLFYRKLQSALAEASIEDGDRPPGLRDMENAYYSIKEMLQTADEDVLSSLLDLFAMEGWPEVQDKPPRPPRDHQRKTIPVDTILQFTNAHDTALEGGCRALGRWIKRDQSNMGKDLFGRTFLHYLVKKRGKLEISSEEFKTAVQPMLECIDDRDRYGMTALHSAAERGNAELIGVLVEHGADKNRTCQGRTALHIAAELGHLDVVQKLIELRANTRIETPQGRHTPLHLAVLGGHRDVVSELLEKKGADAVDERGRRALHLACVIGNKPMVEQLLAHGNTTSSINAMCKHGQTALSLAAGKGHTELVILLLENGASLIATNKVEETALHRAAFMGHKETVRVLLQKGAALDAAHEDGWTALHLAASWGKTDRVDLLLEEAVRREGSCHRGGGNSQDEHAETHLALLPGGMQAFLDATTSDRRTALHVALEGGHKMVVRMLLEHNAAYEMNYKGIEALALSCLDNHKATVGTLLHALLLRKTPAFDVTDTGRRKALHWGKQNGLLKEIVEKVLGWLQEAVKLEKPPDSAAIELTEEAVCVFLQAVRGEGGISGTDTDAETDISGSIAQSQKAETELTSEAEVLKVVNSIEGLLLRLSQGSES
jgi:ankyrin repeat protein